MTDAWLQNAAAAMEVSTPEANDNWMQKAASAMEAEDDAELEVSTGYAMDENPVKAIETYNSSKKLDIPLYTAQQNPDEINKVAKHRDLLKTIQQTRALKKSFKDPNFAAMAKDDVDNLLEIEAALTQKDRPITGFSIFQDIVHSPVLKNAPASIMSSLPSVPAGINEFGALMTDVGETAFGDPLRWMGMLDPDEKTSFGHLSDQFRSIRQVTDPSKEYWLGLKTDTENLSSTEKGVESGLESLAPSLMSMLITARTGNPYAGIAFTGGLEAGHSARTGKEAGLGPYRNLVYSGTSGVAEMAGELLPQIKFLQNLKLGSSIGKTVFDSAVREAPGELGTKLVQESNNFITLQPEATISDFAKSLPEALYQTLIATVTMTGITTGTAAGIVKLVEKQTGVTYPEIIGEAPRARQALEREAVLEVVNRLAGESNLRETAPDVYQEHMKVITEELDTDTVYIDGESFNQVLEDADVTLEELRSVIPSINEQYDNITMNGGEFAIPVPEYMTKIAGTDIGEAIIKHVRLHPNDMTASEARVWEENFQEEMGSQAQEILDSGKKSEEFINSADKVGKIVEAKVLESGHFPEATAKKYATLFKYVAITASNRNPALYPTPEAWLNKFDFKIESIKDGEVVTYSSSPETSRALYQEDIKSTLGINLEEITDAKEQEKIFAEYQRLQANRQQSADRLGSLRPVGEGRIRKGWIENTKIVGSDGLPVLVKRGAKNTLSERTFAKERLSGQTGHPSGGFGVWFSISEEVAARHGAVESFYLDIRNPKIYYNGEIPAVNSPEEAFQLREKLKSEGHDGIIHDMRGIGGAVDFVAFDKEQVMPEGLDSFYQGKKRGSISFPSEGIAQGKTIIRLFEDADLSTLLHETGHFFFEVLRDEANHPESTQQTKDDMQAMLDFVGVESLEKWNSLTQEQRREGHEKVAEAFEVYLYQGKAPNSKLQKLFQTFRAWLGMVYRELQQYLDPSKITPEVRQVFDRMLAAEDAVQTAAEEQKLGPLFATQEEAGATDAEWAKYLENASLANEEATEKLLLRHMKDAQWLEGAKARETKKVNAKANKLRKEAKAKIEEELQETPTYQALYLLRYGKMPGEEGKGTPIKLNTNALKEMYDVKLPVSDKTLVTPEVDTIQVAIAKLGGLNKKQAEAEGIDPDTWKGRNAPTVNQPAFGKRLFVDGGMSFDGMARSLSQYGYLDDAESPNELLDKVLRALGGESIYSVQVDGAVALGEQSGLDWRSLSKRNMTSESGINPDDLADILGFDSGDELVRVLLAAPPLADMVVQLTDQKMMNEHAQFSTPEMLAEAAKEAVHSKARAKMVASEAEFLARLAQRNKPDREKAEAAAQQIITETKPRDLRPAQHEAAERRSRVAQMKAWKNKDFEEAAKQAKKQMLYFYLAKYSRQAQEEVQKIEETAGKYSKPNVRKSLRGEHLAQLDALLARFDFRKSVSDKSRDSLKTYVEKEVERIGAVAPDIAEQFYNENYRKHYRDMTMGELRGFYDVLRQLDFMARREHKMYQEKRQMSFEQERAALKAEIQAARPGAFDSDGNIKITSKNTKTSFQEAKRRVRSSFNARYLNLETLLDVMTVGKGDQIFDSLFGRLSDAQNDQTEMMKQLGNFLKPYTNAYSIKERARFLAGKRKVPGTNLMFTHDEIISMSLFYGNKEGRQRLLSQDQFTDAEIKAVMNMLSKKDVELIQAIWRMSEEMIWPKLAALDTRTRGLPAKKVQAMEFDTPFGKVSGGYVPLVYDPETSLRASNLKKADEIEDILSLAGTPGRTTTKQSASKERLAEVSRGLHLSMAAITSKINETVHDITHREAVMDTWRLINDQQFFDIVRELEGVEVYEAIVERVKEVAAKPTIPSGPHEKTLWILRKHTMIGMMGMSFNTFAVNVLGFLPAINRVGPWRMLRAMSHFGTRPIDTYKMVLEKSKDMRERLMSYDRDMSAEYNRLSLKGTIQPQMTTWFLLLSGMDRFVTMPTWVAAYEKGLQKFKNDDTKAVAYADRIIRQTQGSGRQIDLARISGRSGKFGELKQLVSMFYNFFNAQLGSLVRAQRVAGREYSEGQIARATIRVTNAFLYIVVLPAVLEALARGQCKLDSEFGYCAVRSSFLFSTAMFPLFGGLPAAVWAQFDPELYRPVRLSPVESVLDVITRSPKAIQKIAEGDATLADEKTLIQAAGYITGTPALQMSRTWEGYQRAVNGDGEGLQELLTGKLK